MVVDNNWYQNKPEGYTALLFARIREHHKPDFVISQFGQEAYENFQVAIYMRELLRLQNEADYVCWTPGFPYLYAAIRLLFDKHSIVQVSEVGSTLFATIDKIRKCERTFGVFPSGSRLKFDGIEVSTFFNDVAARIHPQEAITFHDDYTEAPQVQEGVSVGRCYQSSSYAFESTDQLIDWTSQQTFSIQGAWFAITSGDQTIDTLGKRTTFFDYQRFVAELQRLGHRVHHIQTERYTLQGNEFLSCWFLTHKFDDTDFEAFCRLCLFDPRLNTEGIVTDLRGARSEAMPEIIPFKGHHCGWNPEATKQKLRYPLSFDFGSSSLETKFVEHMAQWSGTEPVMKGIGQKLKRFIPWRSHIRALLRRCGI